MMSTFFHRNPKKEDLDQIVVEVCRPTITGHDQYTFDRWSTSVADLYHKIKTFSYWKVAVCLWFCLSDDHIHCVLDLRTSIPQFFTLVSVPQLPVILVSVPQLPVSIDYAIHKANIDLMLFAFKEGCNSKPKCHSSISSFLFSSKQYNCLIPAFSILLCISCPPLQKSNLHTQLSHNLFAFDWNNFIMYYRL